MALSKIKTGSITDSAVTTAKIADGTIVDADVNNVAATKLSGTVADARFPATLPVASGANLTSLPAGNLTGTVADARISTLTSSKLSGALPAIDGASLTGIVAGTDWQSVVTGSTLTAVAGNGYWIDTTLNACTITLPDSASDGDEIIFTDYARNWGTNGIEIDSNGLNYQTQDDTYTVEYGTDGMTLAITYMDATQGWVPTIDEAVTDAPYKGNTEGIFGFGYGGSMTAVTNLVSNAGVVATDTTGVGTARNGPAACGYGGDKGIFAFGNDGSVCDITNLVSNAGVVSSDVAGVGTGRTQLAACEFGGDQGIMGFGTTGSVVSITNLVSNTGVVASDQAATTGTARGYLAACSFN